MVRKLLHSFFLVLLSITCVWAAGNEPTKRNPVRTTGSLSNSFNVDMHNFLGGNDGNTTAFNSACDSEDACRDAEWMRGFVIQGGLHPTAAGKTGTFTTTPLIARTSAGNRIIDSTATLDYDAAGCADDDTAWVIASAMTANTSGNFTRVTGTDYFIDCTSTSQPTLPSDSVWLLRASLVSGALTIVDFLASSHPNDRTDSQTVFCQDNAAYDGQRLAGAVRSLLEARGGTINIFGVCNLTVAPVISISGGNKGLTLIGRGSSEAGQSNAPTVLKWTGGASILFDIDTDMRNITFRDLDFENTGSIVAFLRVGWTDQVKLERVNMRPTVFPSTAAIILGIDANRTETFIAEDVVIRGTGASSVCIAANRVQDAILRRFQGVQCQITVGIAGSVDVIAFNDFGGAYSSAAANTDIFTIYQSRNINFFGTHFENDGTGYAMTVPATAGEVKVNCYGCLFAGAHHGNNPTYIANSDYAAADWTFIDSYAIAYANPYYLLRATAFQSARYIGNTLTGTGAALATALTGNTIALGNILNSSPATTVLSESVNAGGTLTASAHRTCTYTDTDTTPSVAGCTFLYIANTGSTTITNFDDGVTGQTIQLIFADSNTTVTRANAKLCGGTNFVSTADSRLALIFRSSVWYDLGCADPS